MQGTVQEFSSGIIGARREYEDRSFTSIQHKEVGMVGMSRIFLVLCDGHGGVRNADVMTDGMRDAFKAGDNCWEESNDAKLPSPDQQAGELVDAFCYAIDQVTESKSNSGTTVTCASVYTSHNSHDGSMKMQVAFLNCGDSQGLVMDAKSGTVLEGDVLYYHDYAIPSAKVSARCKCETTPHSFSQAREQERYKHELLKMNATPEFRRKDKTLDCEDRTTASIIYNNNKMIHNARTELPEPSRVVSGDDYGMPPHIIRMMKHLQQSPEVSVFELNPTSPLAVVTRCDGFDSKGAVMDFPTVLAFPSEADTKHPPVLAEGLREIAAVRVEKGYRQSSYQLHNEEERAKVGCTACSVGFMHELLQNNDPTWTAAIDKSVEAVNQMKKEFPDGVTLHDNPNKAALFAAHLSVLNGSDDNTSLNGVYVSLEEVGQEGGGVPE